ncbi:MAG: hypothetical protein ABI369_02990 [Acetobacteraceae bacterium]
MKDFVGVKWTCSEHAAKVYDLRYVRCLAGVDKVVTWQDTIGDGGNSGFKALNLAINLGARRIALVGFDMMGRHWHAEHEDPLGNPSVDNLARWRRVIDGAASSIAAMGVTVINCSTISALTAFPIHPLSEAVRCQPGPGS